MSRFLIRHAELVGVLFSTLTVAIVELVLIDTKYGAFRGGFLQSHQIQSWPDRIVFVAAAISLHACAFAVLAAAWFSVARRLRIERGAAVFDWAFWSTLIAGLLIAVRYQIHGYFGDFLTFSIAKSLGGGSVTEAIRYVANEAVVTIVAIMLAIVLYVLARRTNDWSALFGSAGSAPAAAYWRRRVPWAFVACLLLTVAIGNSEMYWRHMRRTGVHLALDRALNAVTDFDGDGYGIVGRPKDMAPFDASINPGALDIPDNGVDEDGLYGDYQHRPRPPLRASPSGAGHPNVVLIVLESSRDDAVDAAASDGRPVMPVLRSIAQAGTRSRHYYSHTGYTISSIKSIFSGDVAESAPPALLPALRRAGYGIHVISGQDEQFGNMAKASGALELSDSFFDARSAPDKRVFSSRAAGSLTLANDEILDQFRRFAQGQAWAKPQFIYLNLQAAHFPYFHDGMPRITTGDVLPRQDINGRNQDRLLRTYLNACAHNDQTIGKIVDLLRGAGQWDNTLLIVIGDHGESLFDDGFLGHGFIISHTQMNTMFVANRAFQAPAVFGHADLAALILSQAGFRVDAPPSATSGVFHYLGELDRPSAIGLTLADRTVLSFDPASRHGTISRPGAPPVAVAYPAQDPAANELVAAVVREWERLRWESHLQRTSAAAKATP